MSRVSKILLQVCDDYAKFVLPLIEQLKAKGCDFFQGEEQKCSFDKLELAIAIAPFLSVVDLLKSFVVEMDASETTVGEVLLKYGRPIAYKSKKVNDVQ